ncbi:MAG TPA: NADH-quinone oxidoreductase subunit J [Dokdonella sp.]|uniref:NADH-quinone oxidoreductase subunit J n=1 Tax=Dokdonella sp. TaxID=2291710 RepID=UPI002BBE9660|nr:NADH-quinone oxidoreductase subunit J [Dokdonella sp.]HOX70150.1 NADH-quinone oxidoreductase subunit J [Dokdonella sp.]HPG94028.1 NADH-quinone oxidoreductase subunit J [Dokdonella sp.]HPN80182.1 NADH-quinone oxidoreductase subunit J [Dokdonella sp.]
MTFELVCFYFFGAVAAAAALAVISVKNPVVAALSLVLTFFSMACVWLLAQAEFLAVALVLVYVGAVMVLFLFVVMMLDVDFAPVREGFVRFLPVGVVVAGVMLTEMLMMIGVRTLQTTPTDDPALLAGMSNMEWLGHTLFRDFLLPFEVAALILTVGLIAAIPLTLRHRSGIKTQNPGRQVMVRREDRIRLVKMPAEKNREAAP